MTLETLYKLNTANKILNNSWYGYYLLGYGFNSNTQPTVVWFAQDLSELSNEPATAQLFF